MTDAKCSYCSKTLNREEIKQDTRCYLCDSIYCSKKCIDEKATRALRVGDIETEEFKCIWACWACLGE